MPNDTRQSTGTVFPPELARTSDVTAAVASEASIRASADAALSTSKFDKPSGSTAQYVRGDGTLATFPSVGSGTVTSVGLSSSDFDVTSSPVTTSGTITANLKTSGVTAGSYGAVTVTAKGIVTAGKRLVTFSGTTDANGNFSGTFSPAFSAAPNIQASITNQSATNQQIRVSSVSTSGFTVNAYARSAVTLLGVEVLLAATTNVSGATVDVLVTEK